MTDQGTPVQPNEQHYQQLEAILKKGRKPKKPFYKRVWFWIVAVVVFFIIVGNLAGGGDDTTTTTADSGTKTTTVNADAPAKTDAEKDADKAAKDAEKAKQEAEAKAKSKEKAHQANIDTLAKQLEEQGLDKKQAEYDAEYSINLQNSGDWTETKAKEWLKQEVENKKYVDWRDSHFSAWNGSISSLVKVVKANMNNPKSFKHVETTYEDMPKHTGFKARMVFRGTNAFNAVMTNSVVATFKYGEDTFTYQFEN